MRSHLRVTGEVPVALRQLLHRNAKTYAGGGTVVLTDARFIICW